MGPRRRRPSGSASPLVTEGGRAVPSAGVLKRSCIALGRGYVSARGDARPAAHVTVWGSPKCSVPRSGVGVGVGSGVRDSAAPSALPDDLDRNARKLGLAHAGPARAFRSRMRRPWIAAAKANPKLARLRPAKVRPPSAATIAAVIAKFRAVCLALPGVVETPTWEKPHFRVGHKIFAACGEPRDPLAVAFKLKLPHARARFARDPRFKRAAYCGKYGWVTLDLAGRPDWTEVRAFVEESYRLIANATAVARLDARASNGGRQRRT